MVKKLKTRLYWGGFEQGRREKLRPSGKKDHRRRGARKLSGICALRAANGLLGAQLVREHADRIGEQSRTAEEGLPLSRHDERSAI